MTRKAAHSSWLAVTVACLGLFGRPAAAYSIGSTMYGEGIGESYTELDEGDLYYGANLAYVDSTLSFNSSEIGEDSDLETSYAVGYEDVDDGPGDYVVAGDHWIQYYDWWEEVGETSDEFNDGGEGECEDCPYPTGESSVYVTDDEVEGYYDGEFYANLSPDADYTGRSVKENVVVTGETCNYMFGGPYDPITEDGYNGSVWTAYADEYAEYNVDYVGAPSDLVDYYLGQMGAEAYLDGCWAWYGTQAMSINDCVYTDVFTQYETPAHSIGYEIQIWTLTGATAYRGSESGPG